MTTTDPISCRSFWDGTWQEGTGAEIARFSPAHPDRLVATARALAPAQLDEAVRSAVQAQQSWQAAGSTERCRVLRRAAVLLEERSEALGRELSLEEGKVLAEGVGEVRRAAAIFDYFGHSDQWSTGEMYATPDPRERVQVTRRPVGCVGVVTPWNFPIAIPAWKIAPALAYGNTVVWKPASHVPLLAYRLVEVLVEAGLPAGVLSLTYGGGAVGQAIVESPGIAAVTFTGSTGIGRRLMATCGDLGRPIQAELGGKNAVVVAEDADLEVAVEAVLEGAFSGNGQKCTATSRVVVVDAVADELIGRLAERIGALRVGDPIEPGTQVGPVVSRADQERIDNSVRDEVSSGRAEVLARAEIRAEVSGSDGHYVAPTLLAVASQGSEVWREELFGPILALRRVATFEEAVALANDSEYGLSGAIFSDSAERIQDAIDQFEVGLLTINGPTTGGYPHLPFGGLKSSSFGPREQGQAAREFFTHTSTTYWRRPRR